MRLREREATPNLAIIFTLIMLILVIYSWFKIKTVEPKEEEKNWNKKECKKSIITTTKTEMFTSVYNILV